MTWRSRHLAWRRNWWLFAALASFTVAMLVLMGADVVVPYTSSKSLAAQTRADAAKKRKAIDEARGLPGHNVKNSVDVFDTSQVHSLTITMNPLEYDAMIADYQRDGLKTWHPATVDIDGVTVKDVGVRLKGNSTLIGLRYSGPDSPPAPGIIGALGSLSSDEPQKMPFLLRFDQFVAGQRYQGVNELALRTPGGFGGDATQLTELVANLLNEESDMTYLRSAAAGMTFNGSSEGFYLAMEHPDDLWAQRMVPGKQEPALYKAIVGASFHYVGDDPTLYANVFNQQAETRSLGPTPMIQFLKFVEESSDEKFEAQLPKRLDVEGFARYLAFHNLIVDPDSLAGTGNNYYFIYDPKLQQMQIASWDQNLAFGRLGFGGGPYRPYYEDGSGIPDFARNIDGLDELIPGSGLGEENLLVKRFFATPKFKNLYDETYRKLFDAMLASGRIGDLYAELAPIIQAYTDERGLIEPDAFSSQVDRNLAFVEDRIEFLRTLPPVAD